MGDSFPRCALRFAAALTVVWRAARVFPPWRLALLLVAVILGAMPSELRADEVKLRQYDETDSQNGNGTVTFQNGAVAGRVEGTFSKIFWARGVGYTNDWRYWILDTYQYSTNNPAGPGSIAYDGLRFTNLVSHGWSGEALADGTQSDAQRTVQDHFNEQHMRVNTMDTNVTSSSTNASFNYNDAPPWFGAAYVYTDTNAVPPRTYDLSRKSVVELITSSNSTSTGSALFRLTTSMFNSYGQAITNGYTVASNTPVNGVVFNVFDDGTTNPVTPVITDTNAHTNYSFTITPQRVQLTGLLWWNPTSSNWSSGPLFVMTNTTVTFTVTANVDNVVWPTNLPVWNCEGRTQNGGVTFTHTFTNISTSADTPLSITATAGNTKTNTAVVYSVEATMTPEDNFAGRSTNEFGVCEIIQFGVSITPSNMPVSEVAAISWNAISNPTNAGHSLLTFSDGTATLKGPTITATISLSLSVTDGFTPWQATWMIPFILPTEVVVVPTTIGEVFDNVYYGTNVWHQQYSSSVGKNLWFYLKPSSVSYSQIYFREGASTNTQATGAYKSLSNHVHSPWPGPVLVLGGDNATGSRVDGVDTSSTPLVGAGQPQTIFLTNGGAFSYDILAQYSPISDPNNWKTFSSIPFRANVSTNGATDLKKDGMPPILREWNAPTKHYNDL